MVSGDLLLVKLIQASVTDQFSFILLSNMALFAFHLLALKVEGANKTVFKKKYWLRYDAFNLKLLTEIIFNKT